MAEKKIIAVVGATGVQGGGLVKAILNAPDKQFTVRAITRNANSDKAKKLAEMGAEVVEADIDDEKSLVKAFDGAYGAFCVTFFWDHMSPEREIEEAERMAKAAKQTGVQHVIWSTLEDTRNWIPLNDNRMPTIHEKYKVPHFDAKGFANHLFTNLGLPVTFLQTSFYWENFIYFGLEPKKDANGKLALTIPMDNKKLPGIAAEDIGKCALGIFILGTESIGKTISIAGEHLTCSEIAEKMSAATGKEIYHNNVSPDIFRSFGFPGADDVGNMFQFKRDFEEYYCGIRDIDATKKLNPSLMNFDEWLKKYKDLIPLD
jgi:uncharacterized protein YbjT (DUF2867 family)